MKLLKLDNLCLIRIKYTLVGFYGRLPGCRAPDLVANPELLDRKLELCKQLIFVLDKIENGISSSKGVIYYEMHMPIFLKAQLNLNCGLLDANLAGKEFEKSIDCIKKSMEHLQYNSKGRKIAKAIIILTQILLSHNEKNIGISLHIDRYSLLYRRIMSFTSNFFYETLFS